MPEYLAPGVYVEEVDTGIKTIEGVSTSVAGMAGVTRRGPTRGLPSLVTSFAEFERLFGGYFTLTNFNNSLPHAVSGFFTNGGRQLYVMRVANGGSQAAKQTKGGIITRLAENVTTSATTTTFKPASTRGMQNGTMVQLRMIKDGTTTDSPARAISSINRSTGVVTLGAAFDTPAAFEFDSRYTTVYTDRDNAAGNLTGPLDQAGRDNSIIVRAKDVGSWGREIRVYASSQPGARAQRDSDDHTANTVTLTSQAHGFYVNAWVEVDRGASKFFTRVTGVNGKVLTLEDFASGALAPTGTDPTTLTVWEIKLTATWGNVTEEYSGLTLENVPGRYIVDALRDSALIEVPASSITSTTTDPFHFPGPDDGLSFLLDDAGTGTDGSAPAESHYIGDGAPGNRSGLKALEDIDRISIIAAPGETRVPVVNALIEQCERLKDRFAIVDPGASTVTGVVAQRQQYDTKYAAIYYPSLRVYDPLTGSEITVPPSGHMAGIYARVDIERGVHKAPANEVVRGIVDFSSKVNKETQDLLNPSPTNVNVLRDFRADGRGLRVWGARVMTSDTSWKYINVRRLFLFLEESIDEGTQWVVFEPNDAPLWSRVRQSISAFLTRVWRDGALQGATAEEAFFVKCDRSTMTQDDIDNGKLIVIVGVAPVKPAEFVIIRISQWTASASSEG